GSSGLTSCTVIAAPSLVPAIVRRVGIIESDPIPRHSFKEEHPMLLRMRQICLVAADLERAEADLTGVFGLEVCYRDPGVGAFGLHNFLLPIGNSFLEVVAPTREGTAGGRYLERRGGDGGYMVIMQCGDVQAARKRAHDLGVRL